MRLPGSLFRFRRCWLTSEALLLNAALPPVWLFVFAQVEITVTTALRFINCVFYGKEYDFGLDANLRMLEAILMNLPAARFCC